MKNIRKLSVSVLMITLCQGCASDRLLFVESSTIGLKARFEGDSPSPASITLGLRRGIVALIPQSERSADATVTTETKVDGGNVKKTFTLSPGELNSLFSRFDANVGFGDPISVRHLLATGSAASEIAANENLIQELTK